MLKYLSPSYYVGAPGSDFHFYLPLAVLFGLLLVASAVAGYVLPRRWKNERWRWRAWRRFDRLGWAVALIGFALLGARAMNLPLASWRLWLLLDLLALVAGVAWLVFFALRRYPRIAAAQALQRQKLQYFHPTRSAERSGSRPRRAARSGRRRR